MDAFKQEIANRILGKKSEVQQWFDRQFELHQAPFYSSYDIRDSGFKIAPVDFNLFPAGFNNICSDDLEFAPKILRSQIECLANRLNSAVPKKIILLPENHTTNKFYAENVWNLLQIFKTAGFQIELGWTAEISESIEIQTASGKSLTAFAVDVEKSISSRTLTLKNGSTADWLVLNNDFSGGYPAYLDQIQQPILPSHKMGWHTRRKSNHFRHYNGLVTEFSQILELDPWTFQVESEVVRNVDFNEGIGLKETAEVAERILNKVRDQYQRRNIATKPAVFVKSDSGTYGMGIHVVHDAKEILEMNRRAKNKLSQGKGKSEIRQVIVQEGIPSKIVVEQQISEPVIYMFGCQLLGGFIRSNSERGEMENLNSQGMLFRKLCMRDFHDALSNKNEDIPVLEAVYGSLSRIAALASSIETEEVTKK